MFSSSKEFTRLFSNEAIEPQLHYLPLKEDLRQWLLIKIQRRLTKLLAEASLRGEVFDLDFLQKYSNIQPNTNSVKSYAQWVKIFAQEPPLKRYSTGIPFLDEQLGGGFVENSLVLLGGQSDTGKTTLGVQILRHVSQTQKALYFSFEFPLRNFCEKAQDAKTRHDRFCDEDFFYMADTGTNIEELVAQIKRQAKEGVKFFLIDSQMMIEAGTKMSKRNEEDQTKKFSRLAQLVHGQKLGIVIMLIVQGSKSDPKTPFDSVIGHYLADAFLFVSKLNPVQEPNEDKRNYLRQVYFIKNKMGGSYKKCFFKVDHESFSFIQLGEHHGKKPDDAGNKKALSFLDIKIKH
ncbi:RAD55 family ATPase [Helicobacter bizzozeronii]|uniref:RAD55 family ATPase n=1 Tax=Helicobacter bizzozeronii TaxID=56877 RepID=UPI001F442A12|nr:ATPase domain-containing protein [Helicobacter bizzozeronii]